MSKVLCLGELVLDWVNNDGMTPEWQPHAAGTPANVAVALRRQGVTSAMITPARASNQAPSRAS